VSDLAVEIRNAHKSYGDVRALRGVSLGVRRGEFLTLLGPSGSGKTTLLHAIAGFQRLDAGAVVASGVDITNLPAHRRGFGLVFQHYALFPHMTVADNIAYPLRIRGDNAASRADRVREYLELVELGQHGGRYPEELSGGQRQRVALARALVFGPPLLLMDEPLGALDRRLRQSIQFRIKRIQQELKATVIHVTHDQEEALAMSDVIAVMRDGQVEQVGTPQDLYLRPATPFVAGFMGETNRLNVELLEADAAGPRAQHLESRQFFSLVGSAPAERRRFAPGSALLCVRPEHVRLGDPISRGLEGELVSRTFMGDHWRYEVKVGPSILVVKDTDGGKAAGMTAPAAVHIDLDATSVQIFRDVAPRVRAS
jgi:ABC-type Fe3+/spermidine/putrescine transport system ATPase subunit